ncbi:MAG: hypothetical protein ACRD1C_08630 [Terriglobales bacterium]
MDFGDPGERDALSKLTLARWNARIQKQDVKWMRAASGAECGRPLPNRSGGSARLAHLLEFVRCVTGRPHRATLAKLLGLARWHVQPDALRMTARKKPKE